MPVDPDTTFTCPIHGTGQAAFQISQAGDPDQFVCYACWQDFLTDETVHKCELATPEP